jgi:hypothetical protein
MPNVPIIMSRMGRYATHADAKVTPKTIAYTMPEIQVEIAKIKFAIFSPMEAWTVSKISAI